MKLLGRVALVTGASVYMGEAVCAELAREGARVAVHDSSPERAEEIAATIVDGGGEALPLTADLTDSRQVDALVAEASAWHGHLDILVNNASAALTDKPLVDSTDAEWRALLAINLSAVVYTTRAALGVMLPQRRGKIINITSESGVAGSAMATLYSATRGGANAFTQAVGREAAPHNIQVNAIAQAFVDNHLMWAAMGDDQARMAAALQRVPAGRLGRPDETAKLAVFLASDDSDFIVGQVLNFSGGLIV